MILKCVSWNLLKGGIDAEDDARMRRQMRRIVAENPTVVMLQELNDWGGLCGLIPACRLEREAAPAEDK